MKFQLNLNRQKKKNETSDFTHLLKGMLAAKCKVCGNEYYGDRAKSQVMVCSISHHSRHAAQMKWDHEHGKHLLTTPECDLCKASLDAFLQRYKNAESVSVDIENPNFVPMTIVNMEFASRFYELKPIK